MRQLRNKKTGEIYEPASKDAIDVYFYAQVGDGKALTKRSYDSISKLNEEWEDHVPKEPYIGDEATAKFVRAWAKHWGIEKVMARIRFDHGIDLVGWVEDSGGREIDIQGAFVSGEIKDCNEYTIAELCREEEG